MRFFSKIIFSLFFAIIAPSAGFYVFAASPISNTGFIQENIWYSHEPLVEGESVKIHTIVFNSREESLSGTVQFYDGSVILGKKVFSVAGGEAKDVSIDWKITAGDHAIYAEIVNPKIAKSDGTLETVLLDQNRTANSERTVAKLIKKNPPSETNTAVSDAVLKTETFIKENVPSSISKPIVETASSVDAWRDETSKIAEAKKDEVKKEIEKTKISGTFETGKSGTKITPSDSALHTPIQYAKLFLLSLAVFVFKNKIIFYGLCAIIAFLILRMLWRKIFRK